MAMDIKKMKFKVDFDPVGWSGYGQYLIKVDNAAETPFSIVMVGWGDDPEKAKAYAKEKADRICKALNILRGLEL